VKYKILKCFQVSTSASWKEELELYIMEVFDLKSGSFFVEKKNKEKKMKITFPCSPLPIL